MSEVKTNGITMLLASNHIHANADITFTVAERGEVESVHVADAIGKLILDNFRQQEAAVLPAGSYKGSLTMVISAIELPEEEAEPEEEKPKPKPKKKPAKKTKKATKKRAVRKSKDS